LKVTKVEVLHGREPVALPEPWVAAWSGEPRTQLDFTAYRVHTDEGVEGVGPFTGDRDPEWLLGTDPFHVGGMWDQYLSGRGEGGDPRRGAGLEIALWDIMGKASGQPVYRLLGAFSDQALVYAATSRLLVPEAHVDQVLSLQSMGFRAVKLRLHRPDVRDDLAVVSAVRDAVGDEMLLLVDANQNHNVPGYTLWSRGTALWMAEQLDQLKVYFLEEPLPRADVEGLAAIAASVDMLIAGGEHSPTVYDFRPHIVEGAYDVIQPDVILNGKTGIIGIRKAASMAEYFDKLVVPHVVSNPVFPLAFAATLHAMASVANCPVIEYPCDPPILTTDSLQSHVQNPLEINDEGRVCAPQGPGLGVLLDEDRITIGRTT